MMLYFIYKALNLIAKTLDALSKETTVECRMRVKPCISRSVYRWRESQHDSQHLQQPRVSMSEHPAHLTEKIFILFESVAVQHPHTVEQVKTQLHITASDVGSFTSVVNQH